MPKVAEFVDKLREQFEQVNVIYAEENGKVVGIKPVYLRGHKQ